ncbi:MAG: GNAT family N-acetyltransferase [Christensenellaceae bacterium]|nr:GNAT family N-acetyltransferase [Christensenellaceae bacterium]MBR2224013.1 GNAT family N-acetyltransferase [Christensenellaceae bacterium]MBR3842636.1 GNAT family N-acetyltransferase [Christensenellaceae bacterium]
MEITTERLCLRPFRHEDWRDLHEYLSDPETVRYEPYETHNEAQCKRIARSRVYDNAFFAICLGNADGKMIGNLYFREEEPRRYELGYIINPAFRRQGFAYEASQALMHYAFHTLGAEEIFAMCCIENSASYRLMERLSMKRQAHHTQYMYFGLRRFGRRIYEDVFEYNITAAEYLLRSCQM